MQALLVAAFAIAHRLLHRVTRVLSLRAPPQYLNPATGTTFSLDKPRWCDDASGEPQPLLVTPLPGIGRHQIAQNRRSLWRYAAAFPLACAAPISLGAGCPSTGGRCTYCRPGMWKDYMMVDRPSP